MEVLGPLGPAAERCACPRGYGGAQCARCAAGHVRAGVECVPCACNEHAQCLTGQCTVLKLALQVLLVANNRRNFVRLIN